MNGLVTKVCRLLSVLLLLSSQLLYAQNQLGNWYLFQPSSSSGKNIRFNGPGYAPTLGPSFIQKSSHSTYSSSNAYYSPAGDLVFYVISDNVGTYIYDKNNNVIKNDLYPIPGDSIPVSDTGEPGEISIIPIPNTCDRFHILIGHMIYEMKLGSVTSLWWPTVVYPHGAISYALDNLQSITVGGLGYISTGYIPYTGGANYPRKQSTSAITKLTNNKYTVYFPNGCNRMTEGIYKVDVDCSTYPATMSNYSLVATYANLGLSSMCSDNLVQDMELSPNQNYLAIAKGRELVVRNLLAGTNKFDTPANSDYLITGLEFNNTSNKLAIAGFFKSSTTLNSLYSWDHTINPHATVINNSVDYAYTQLELGRDGKVYGLASNKLGEVDFAGNTMNTAISLPFTVPFTTILGGVYPGYKMRTLPDQIDGYHYYQAVPGTSPGVVVSQSPLVLCGTGNVTLTASGAPVGYSYKWYEQHRYIFICRLWKHA